MKATLQVNDCEITLVPTEGKWFQVNPLAIDQTLFCEKRSDSKQEETRQLILEAFEELKRDSKYELSFKTMIPEKTWGIKDVKELKALSGELGDHIADWVEQALEWAQRIANGEAWKDICNKPDNSNWYRLVIWKNGYARRIGGSCRSADYIPASDINSQSFIDYGISCTVPLVVSYN